jgi:aminoglycoside phosphotransferase (APT) family kinase protein
MSRSSEEAGAEQALTVGDGLERLTAYLADELGVPVGEVAIERLTEGHSNLTYSVACDGALYVLRRPPFGPLAPSAHDVLREYRVLSTLEGAGARTPRAVLACSDPEVFGAPFYLMEHVEGVVLREDLPPGLDPASAGADVSTELIDALVELHEVDWERAGFGEIASGNGYLERQLRLWQRQWEHNRTRELADVEAIGRWLAARFPEESAVTIVHGDYKVDNLIFAEREGRLRAAAIVDWEMATLGDPLADLGFLTAVWSEPGEDPAELLWLSKITTGPGFDSRRGLAERYAGQTGRDVVNLRWYQVLALWKLAILLEGSYARFLAGTTDDSWFRGLEEGIPTLLRRARALARDQDEESR